MTGLEGKRHIYLPLEVQDRLPNSFYPSRQIDSLLPEGPVIVRFIIPLIT